MKPPAQRASRGSHAEDVACRHLESRGLRLVERNFRTPRGEIDLVMRDGTTLVFVEVRLRNNSRYGSAAETVDRRKQERLLAAALGYLQKHRELGNPATRFDVVAISAAGNVQRIEWIVGAFAL